MSGMFERIARRHPDRPRESGDQATTDLPVGDQPTERMEAVEAAPSAAEGRPPTEPPPPPIDLTTRLAPIAAADAQPSAAMPTSTPQPAQADAAAAAQPAAAPAASPPPPVDPAAETVVAEPAPRRPGFRARGRMRRRLRYLRKLRELQVRDLGGLVFDLRRFERTRDDLLVQKIDQIRACDDELRALEQALDERRDLRDVREPGIGGTCPRCFAIYGSADKFCSNCGAAFGGAVQGPAAQVPLAPTPPPAGGPGPQT
jgi:hypothetical protein